MKVNKKYQNDLEVVDNLQRLSRYKNKKNSKEKNPKKIFLQKISFQDNNIPIKVQLVKTNNNENNFHNSNSTSLSSNKNKIPCPKIGINYYFSKKNKYETNYQDNNQNRDSTKNIKGNTKTNNNRVISESPVNHTKYKHPTYKILNQNPILKTPDNNNINVNIDNNYCIENYNYNDHENKTQNINTHKIRNVLSKNLAYNKKNQNNTVSSNNIVFERNYLSISKHSCDSNNSISNNYGAGAKTFIGRDNYSIKSSKNKSNHPPKTPSCVTDIDSYNLKNNKNNNININNNMNNFINNYLIDIKLEDIIILEERLNDINIAINHGNTKLKNSFGYNNKIEIGASNECYEFFIFYFHSSLKYKIPLFFNEANRIIIQSAINLKLLIIMITYHLSINQTMIINLLDDLKIIYSLLKQNLYLFIKKMNIFYGEGFILQNEIYFRTFNYILSKNGLNNLNENEIKDMVNQNCCIIVKNITDILEYKKASGNPFYLDFNQLLNILSRITEKAINNYFSTYLYGLKKPQNIYNIKNSDNIKYKSNHIKIDSNINNNIKYNINNNQLNDINNGKNNNDLLEYKKNKFDPPYITTPTNKKYTLVLDLENTLISLNDNNTNDIYNLRPGLLSFLNTLKPIYELISFTNESKEYSDSLLQEIETNKKYFDYNLYKEHNTLKDNKLVKDISKIGRDMKKIIIVDKSSDNIKSTPQNGILIKPYYGEINKNDTVLFELKKLLILFHKMGYEELKVAIKNNENDIKYKITLDNNN